MGVVTKKISKVVGKRLLVGNYWEVSLEFDDDFCFMAGQYLSIKVDESGLRRSYSIASNPGDKLVKLMIDVTPMGPGSRYVLGLKMGDCVEVVGPMGDFVVRENQMAKLFIATGSGIAPFLSMITSLLGSNYAGRVSLLWGVRYEKDLFWIDEFDRLREKYNNFEYKVVLSKADDGWVGSRGHVNDFLLDDLNGWEGYLCGNKAMVAEIRDLLVTRGMKSEDVSFEKFS